MTQKARGYDIQYQKQGDSFLKNRVHAWGMNGELPSEWEEVKQESDVQRAVIFPSTQRRFRADKRKYIDSYTSEQGA